MNKKSKDKEESKLLNTYLTYEPNLTKIYVIPPIENFIQTNTYLRKLYEDIVKNKAKLGLEIEGLSVSKYPKIFFRHFIGEKSILHHHWYEFNSFRKLFFLMWKTFWIVLYKLIGGKVIWTVHNKYPHDRKYLKANKLLRKFFAKLTNGLHVHCQSAIGIMQPILKVKETKFFVLEHPKFDVKIIEREKAIEILNKKYFLEKKVSQTDQLFLMFGQIAPYKGILEIMQIFKEEKDTKKKLLVVGKVKAKQEEYLKKLKMEVKNSTSILLLDKVIREEEVYLFFNAADFVVLNHKGILTSALIYQARDYQKHIISTKEGCNQDLNYSKIIYFETEKEFKGILNQL
ncbi:MAG: hypothetical protein ACTSP3_12800 [Candidatus Heimdallarchaeaceae archaeon]